MPTIMRADRLRSGGWLCGRVRDRGLPRSRTPCLLTHLLSGRATGRRGASADSGSSRRVPGATAPTSAGSRSIAAIKARWLPTKIDCHPDAERGRRPHGVGGDEPVALHPVALRPLRIAHAGPGS